MLQDIIFPNFPIITFSIFKLYVSVPFCKLKPEGLYLHAFNEKIAEGTKCLVTWVHVPTISVRDFQRLSAPDWNSCFIS
jgi:hypothetical protein